MTREEATKLAKDKYGDHGDFIGVVPVYWEVSPAMCLEYSYECCRNRELMLSAATAVLEDFAEYNYVGDTIKISVSRVAYWAASFGDGVIVKIGDMENDDRYEERMENRLEHGSKRG